MHDLALEHFHTARGLGKPYPGYDIVTVDYLRVDGGGRSQFLTIGKVHKRTDHRIRSHVHGHAIGFG
jgi:hypothetical protein